MNFWVDRLGGVASATCALHCLAMTLAPAVLLSGEAFEWGFYALAIAFAGVACVLGYRAHRDRRVVLGFGVGTLVLTSGRFGEMLGLHETGVALAVAGGAVLVASHVWSLRRTRACCA
ncbi:MAG: MerC domain-containing protein [Proteobacteria bacterium]|nr:MerC domain-containing protein [Pseudomonadota bacterium]